ncbi:MAG: adenosylmethionine decarboxylase [Hyphomicrobiaceae bacterium]|nr:adenosylmethionine decarboxylase [Hyphomicrobiaceae bacterium]
MAYDDTLFQLGMDLTRSSTAQKEDFGVRARVATNSGLVPLVTEDRKDFFIERNGIRYAGIHLIIDLFGARRLNDVEHVEATLKRCVDVAGANLLHIHVHQFEPNGGVSGVAVLAESHISIHSWPEVEYAALDVFMCGDTKPELCVGVLKEAFAAEDVQVRQYNRGREAAERKPERAARRRIAATKAQVAAVTAAPQPRKRRVAARSK